MPAENEEPELRIEQLPAQCRELAARISKLEGAQRHQRRLALIGSAIAFIALLALIASAIAAYSSYKLAHRTDEKSGSILSSDPKVRLSGSCKPSDSLTMYIHVVNRGRTTGRVNGMSVTVQLSRDALPEQTRNQWQQLYGNIPNQFQIDVASTTDSVVIEPLLDADISLPVDCERIRDLGLTTVDAIGGSMHSVSRMLWQLWPVYAYDTPISFIRLTDATSV